MKELIFVFLILPSLAYGQQFHVGMSKGTVKDTASVYHMAIDSSLKNGRLNPRTSFAMSNVMRYNTPGTLLVTFDDIGDTALAVSWSGKGFNDRDLIDITNQEVRIHGNNFYRSKDMNNVAWYHIPEVIIAYNLAGTQLTAIEESHRYQ